MKYSLKNKYWLLCGGIGGLLIGLNYYYATETLWQTKSQISPARISSFRDLYTRSESLKHFLELKGGRYNESRRDEILNSINSNSLFEQFTSTLDSHINKEDFLTQYKPYQAHILFLKERIGTDAEKTERTKWANKISLWKSRGDLSKGQIELVNTQNNMDLSSNIINDYLKFTHKNISSKVLDDLIFLKDITVLETRHELSLLTLPLEKKKDYKKNLQLLQDEFQKPVNNFALYEAKMQPVTFVRAKRPNPIIVLFSSFSLGVIVAALITLLFPTNRSILTSLFGKL